MKNVLVFVTTLDGKITKWGEPLVTTWPSEKDKEYFRKKWNDSKLIVMGSTSYHSARLKPSSKRLLVVMTKDLYKYINQEVLGQLEFTNESPVQLVKRYTLEGIEQMVIIGGPHVATSFLKEQLIDELYLTIEPRIFGTGGNFVTEEKLDINLRLISCEKVNDNGTLITKYTILKK